MSFVAMSNKMEISSLNVAQSYRCRPMLTSSGRRASYSLLVEQRCPCCEKVTDKQRMVRVTGARPGRPAGRPWTTEPLRARGLHPVRCDAMGCDAMRQLRAPSFVVVNSTSLCWVAASALPSALAIAAREVLMLLSG